MGKIIQIASFIRDCNNCRWQGLNACQAPGGWKWDMRFQRCVTFGWSQAALEAQRKELKQSQRSNELDLRCNDYLHLDPDRRTGVDEVFDGSNSSGEMLQNLFQTEKETDTTK